MDASAPAVSVCRHLLSAVLSCVQSMCLTCWGQLPDPVMDGWHSSSRYSSGAPTGPDVDVLVKLP